MCPLCFSAVPFLAVSCMCCVLYVLCLACVVSFLMLSRFCHSKTGVSCAPSLSLLCPAFVLNIPCDLCLFFLNLPCDLSLSYVISRELILAHVFILPDLSLWCLQVELIIVVFAGGRLHESSPVVVTSEQESRHDRRNGPSSGDATQNTHFTLVVRPSQTVGPIACD